MLIFCLNHWMEDSPLISLVDPKAKHNIVQNARVSDFIRQLRQSNLNSLVNILPKEIVNKIKAIPIPVTNIEDKII